MKVIGVISLPVATPTGNMIKRMHPQLYKRLRDTFTLLVKSESLTVRRCEKGERRRIVITRYGARVLDYDNLVGGAKPLVDAIRRSELIEDDRPACVDLEYNQNKCPKKDERTVITITEVAE